MKGKGTTMSGLLPGGHQSSWDYWEAHSLCPNDRLAEGMLPARS